MIRQLKNLLKRNQTWAKKMTENDPDFFSTYPNSKLPNICG